MFYYVYYSYEQFGRGYIGFRQCKVPPSEDTSYFGTYSDPSFCPTDKIILVEYDEPKQALEAEISLHSFFDVARNPHFANRARQTSVKFSTVGTKLSEDHKQKIREAARKNPQKYITRAMLGKKHSEETKRKMSEAAKLQTYSEETKRKMSESAKKRVHTEEENLKIAQTLKNKPEVQCPFCEKTLKEHYLARHLKCIHEES
jgi:hypothetical protein